MKTLNTHVRLLVSDFPACFRFYRDVMGLTPTWGKEDEAYASFKINEEGAFLALFRRELMAEAVGREELPPKRAAQDVFVMIIEVDDVRESAKTLAERGATIVTEATERPDWGLIVAHLRDPDGNLIEINSAMPMSE